MSLTENVVDVAIAVAKVKKAVAFICVLYHRALALLEWDLTAKPSMPPSLKWLTQLPRQVSPEVMYQQVAFSDEKAIHVLSSDVNGSSIRSVDLENGSINEDIFFSGEEVRGLVTPLIKTNSNTSVLLTRKNVVDLRLSMSNKFEKSRMPRSKIPPNLSPRVEAVSLQMETIGNANGSFPKQSNSSDFVIFGLSDNGSLFANERLLARNCTSLLVTPAHLIFTTGQHLLKFVHMARVDGELPYFLFWTIQLNFILDLDVPPDTPEVDERCRSIERGAKLVTVMPSIFALVLQMPRGNLETVYPRALVLAGIRHSINSGKYKKAFLACRSQRVDMNILHDHDPSAFLANVGLFIDQLEKVEYLDLFLSQLRCVQLCIYGSLVNNRRDEDVSKTMYIETSVATGQGKLDRANAMSTSLHDSVSKVNTICDAILKTLHGRMPSRFQNAVTAHVCKNPPDLDAGLSEIVKIRGIFRLLITITKMLIYTDQNPAQVDRLVEHICFLADVNRLFDNALGIYDLDLTLLVAQQSQKV